MDAPLHNFPMRTLTRIDREAAAFDAVLAEQRRRLVRRESVPEVSKPAAVVTAPNQVIRTKLSIKDIIGNIGGPRRAIRPSYAW